MKQVILEYLQRLDYRESPAPDDSLLLRHAQNGHSFNLVFVEAVELAGLKVSREGVDMLIVLNGNSLTANDIEFIEVFMEKLPERVGVAIYQNDALEHVMKDIWFFLTSRGTG